MILPMPTPYPILQYLQAQGIQQEPSFIDQANLRWPVPLRLSVWAFILLLTLGCLGQLIKIIQYDLSFMDFPCWLLAVNVGLFLWWFYQDQGTRRYVFICEGIYMYYIQRNKLPRFMPWSVWMII
jgi:hypothetical protein